MKLQFDLYKTQELQNLLKMLPERSTQGDIMLPKRKTHNYKHLDVSYLQESAKKFQFVKNSDLNKVEEMLAKMNRELCYVSLLVITYVIVLNK